LKIRKALKLKILKARAKMSDDLNQFTFTGRLTRDSEIKAIDSGATVCNFTIAVNKKISDDREIVNFFDIEKWGNVGNLSTYLTKGILIVVSGEVSQLRWQDQTGNNRSRIVFKAYKIKFLGNEK
jgi:single-strand DNA-binding protein